MTKPNDGGPAFAHATDYNGEPVSFGMTLLDYFAAHAPALPENLHPETLKRLTGLETPKCTTDEEAHAFWLEANARWRWAHAQNMLRVRSDYVGEQQ